MTGALGDNRPGKLKEINIDPTKVQGETISGNLANLAAAQELGSKQNAFNAAELNKSQETTMPGWGALRDEITKTLTSMAKGEVSDSVRYQQAQEGAAKGINLGTQGSQRNKFSDLQRFGLASLEIQGKGIAATNSWLQAAPKAPLFDVSSMFFNPQQRLGFELDQAKTNVGIQQFNNWVDSMPSPFEQGLGQIAGVGDSLLNMYAGSKIQQWMTPKSDTSATGSGGGGPTAQQWGGNGWRNYSNTGMGDPGAREWGGTGRG